MQRKTQNRQLALSERRRSRPASASAFSTCARSSSGTSIRASASGMSRRRQGSFRQSKARQTRTTWTAARGRIPRASWMTRSEETAGARPAAGQGAGRVHLVDDQDTGPPRGPGRLREHQYRRFLETETASQVRGGRRREHMIEPERQHRQFLRTRGVHQIDYAGGLPGAGPSGQDALARGSLQAAP